MNILNLITFRKTKKQATPSLVTASAEFQHEFVHTTDRLLRKRFFWFYVVFAGILAIQVVTQVVVSVLAIGTDRAPDTTDVVVNTVLYLLQLCVCAGGIAAVKRLKMSREQMVRTSQIVLVLIVLFHMIASAVQDQAFEGNVWNSLMFFFLYHVVACLVLPWTPKQALTPAYAVLAIFAATEVVRLATGNVNPPWMIAFDLLSVFTVLPGLAICALRHSSRTKKFKMGFLQDRYADMRRELYGAQQIHESIFPDEVLEGDVQLRYEYQPMRQIGGDFLFIPPARKGDPKRTKTHVVMLDVTGHGIGAALTVNRLHGELERLYAENPDIEPDEVMRKMNRYIHLTLAIHSVYATGVAVSIDHEKSELKYASAGHPPSFLRGVDGTLEDLPSTGLLLGVSMAHDYLIEMRTHRFVPGDTLIAYTDGVIECRNDKNRMIGVDGLRQVLASKHNGTTYIETVTAMVDSHRAAVANDDDVLVVEVTRALQSEK
ncbi:MAG: serine/threonine-protein phosphatase [Phycisphaeraceae bacterium]|nr:serine/threonine-protein phosphatase [Phycisphaerales bacterium]MCB9860114.1 serine/threonine-protein phosphatase [Phycisphaeraceae bacterium]